MAKSKKATPSRTSTKTKSTNSTNKNRTVAQSKSTTTVTKSDVATAKAVVKKQLAPPILEEKTIERNSYGPSVPKPPKFEDFKQIGSLVPFRSFLPEGYVVLVNVNYITSVQNYTTHTDSVQIGLLSGTTQLVKHSIMEVLEAIERNLS